ncbi:MAG: MoaD family protein [Candidatus Heimdallarchaeota archaeon]|nr:MAG: MoaD family protein [Candidatus Heimdallarchaeota archaeon]
MTVTVNFFGPLAQWAGRKTVSAQGTTVREVLVALETHLGKPVLNHLINQDTGKIKSHYHLLLNGRDIESLKGLNEPVKNGDVITCVPPVGGGMDSSFFS